MTDNKKSNHTKAHTIYLTVEEDKKLREKVRKTDHLKFSVYVRDVLFPPKPKKENE